MKRKSKQWWSTLFHQDQQNEQSPLTLTHWTKQKTLTFDIENPGPVLKQEQKCGRANYIS